MSSERSAVSGAVTRSQAQSRFVHRSPLTAHRSRGFTLIELIAAFVIFAIGFGILLQILSTCLHTTAQSADYTRAALWAQSMLDVQGVGEPLQEGDSSGKFDDKFSWQLHVGKIQPPEEPQTAAPVAGNANGQQIHLDGKLIGSKIIGQNFGTPGASIF